MANLDRPRGFEPYGPVRLAVKAVAGAAVRPGEFVALSADGKVDPVAAGGDIYGLALSNADSDGDNVLLSVHPEQRYVGQADGSDIDAQTDIGNNCDVLATADNSTYKTARMEIDSSTIAASAAQLTILDIVDSPNNAFGAQVDVIVKVNEHQIFGENDSAGI